VTVAGTGGRVTVEVPAGLPSGTIVTRGEDNKLRPVEHLLPDVKPAGVLFTTGDVRQPRVAFPGTGGTRCPSCDQMTVRKVDGCPLCVECGWGRCS
jgi:hypothetical protein